jgi:hypothetical protein
LKRTCLSRRAKRLVRTITDKAREIHVENVQDNDAQGGKLFCDQQREVNLRPVGNDPGHYKFLLLPEPQAGAYNFRFFGE